MTRRKFLQSSGGAGLLSACAGPPAAKRPNVLLIALDDLNDWVGCLGVRADAHTPNIDRLAARGMLFTDAHCASPKCNPSRTALFTGLMPATTGIYDNGHWWKPHLPDAVTMPEYFRRSGYCAAGGGKIFHHTSGFNPPGQWDEYFALQFDDPWDRRSAAYYGIPQADPPPNHPLNGIRPFRHEFDWGSLPLADNRYADARTIAWAADFLARKHDKPFFLAVGLFHPHLPWYAPERFFAAHPAGDTAIPNMPENDLDDIPAAGLQLSAAGRQSLEAVRASGKHREAVAAYLANIRYADELVGRLLDALDGSAYGTETIVVLFSDHGFHLGEKEHWHKSTLWQRATHVPLAVIAPGTTEPATSRDMPVSLIDLYPTLLDLCRLPPKADLDGQSLAPLLSGGSTAAPRSVLATFRRGNHVVKTKRWSYIRYAAGGEELYDRLEDPDEIVNLAGRVGLAPVKKRLAARLPPREAAAAPLKSAYDFDPTNYSWAPK